MYIHLGGGAVVRERDIVGIFDLDYCSTSARTRDFLKKAQQNGEVVDTTEELPKAFAVCSDESGKKSLYISGVSVQTLKKRAVSSSQALTQDKDK